MANSSRSKTAENYSAQYKANKVWEKNRKRRLARVLKEQPNNGQVKAAMDSMVYRRKTPGEHGWTASQIASAKLLKKFCGVFDRAAFHPDPKLSQSALARTRNTEVPKAPYVPNPSYGTSFFALGARLNGAWK